MAVDSTVSGGTVQVARWAMSVRGATVVVAALQCAPVAEVARTRSEATVHAESESAITRVESSSKSA